MLSIETLIAFSATSALLALVPGPDNIFVMTQSALVGRRAGLMVVLGLCCGLAVHTAAVALGLAAAMQAVPAAFTVLKTLGAAYLVYLAWGAFRAGASALQNKEAPRLSPLRLVGRGMIMNISNPKVAIFMLAFLPQFVNPALGNVAMQILILGLVMALVTLLVFGSLAVAAGMAGQKMAGTGKAQVILQRVAGVVFLGLAFKLLTQK
ncbi:Homoserine/homoserine lactone efflux protein [Thalassovita autumnalis]|jgi:threonine/homoserine/homoserine lactone efflux protein|uniref:Homoserine/homoserine lactone efflux protein n=1 Tax=Thalassovita autumnalis TaxID=2072972 RepID=A0A0P1FTD8_9RHOB|nr:LysE family translocator [Thalassovita autumnalis]MEC7963996.1 LysE family translocator [Pseudomonadota bacterium]CUH65126.1 Homoserine/homoserine lactone efflux protein [Thalassovita autumnalis]CUH71680.1 Homoserine/homoserine lactone efflux protein [Thalassovita autumnalis]